MCDPFFHWRTSATKKLKYPSLQTVVAASRVIAYEEAAESAHKYVRLSRTVSSMCTKNMMHFIVQRLRPTYQRRKTPAELTVVANGLRATILSR